MHLSQRGVYAVRPFLGPLVLFRDVHFRRRYQNHFNFACLATEGDCSSNYLVFARSVTFSKISCASPYTWSDEDSVQCSYDTVA